MGQAISRFVHDGDVIVIEGFTHLIALPLRMRYQTAAARLYLVPSHAGCNLRPVNRRGLRAKTCL